MKSKVKPAQYNTTTIRMFTNILMKRVVIYIELNTDYLACSKLTLKTLALIFSAGNLACEQFSVQYLLLEGEGSCGNFLAE